MQRNSQKAFTLLEVSIVLTIIGLLVGGVLVGQDLVRAAGVKATITQVQKYQAATSAFQEKFGALPGDLTQTIATQYGFAARNATIGLTGEGDGNGLIQSSYLGTICMCQMNGESVMFWSDLTYANGLNLNMIEGTFNLASSTVAQLVGIQVVSPNSLYNMIPKAKIGRDNTFTVYSSVGINYYALSGVEENNMYVVNPGLTPLEAYSIDSKMDDGLPQTGNVTAQYVGAYSGNISNVSVVWATGNTTPQMGSPSGPHGSQESYSTGTGASGTAATSGATYTCYDNGNVAGATQQYSIKQSGGNNLNCGLSFQFAQ